MKDMFSKKYVIMDHTHILKNILKLSQTQRDTIMQLAVDDIAEIFEETKKVFIKFHENILAQANLSAVEKKILSYFFSVTHKQHLEIIFSAVKQEKLTKETVRELYIQVLHQRTITAAKMFLEKDYFPQYIKSILTDQDFMDELEQHSTQCITQWPQAKKSLIHQYKSRSFYEKNKEKYIEKHMDTVKIILQEHENKVLKKLLEENDEDGDIVNFFVHEVLHFCDPIKHKKLLKIFFANMITESISQSHTQRVESQNKKDQIKSRQPYKKNLTSIEKQDIASSSHIEQIKNTKKEMFDAIFGPWEEKADHKTKNIYKSIKSYMFRCYLHGTDIRMKNIYDRLWSAYIKDLEQHIRTISTQLGIQIQESSQARIKTTPWEQTQEQKQQTTNLLPVPQATAEKIVPTSQTLQALQDTPEKLHTALLITICKELWYTFWDEKEFAMYADDLWLDKEWKNAIALKKKLIDYLLKWWEEIWIVDGWRKTKTYEKLTFNDGIRMVKQKNTILWLVDHKNYVKFINKYFVWNKTDFHKIQQESTQTQ